VKPRIYLTIEQRGIPFKNKKFWIVGSSPMTMKRKQLQVLLEAVFHRLSFSRRREPPKK
jgi:hypothetical protein